VNTGASETTAITNLNNALQGNVLTRAANITAVDNGAGKITLVSGNGTNFRLNAFGAANAGFGFVPSGQGVDSASVGTLTASSQNGSASPSLDANGVSTSGFLNFAPISIGGNSQTVAINAPDASGGQHSISFSLNSGNAGNIDAALNSINSQLLESNDPTLQNIVAVKDQSAGADGIRFVSSSTGFTVSLGSQATGTAPGVIQGLSQGTGAGSQGGPVTPSTQLGTGATADVGSQTNAENAVTAITAAVQILGRAQAAVGKGENNFTYAVNLAQSQVTNEAAAESRIRDADMAAEAANLSKAQILVQAGTAALAQANSAPQAVLSLLRGQ
jgi:flagellin